MSVIAPDVSEHQGRPVDDSYNRRWLIFRVCFGGGYTDQQARANLAWAVKARAAGKIDGFTVYVVYLPGQNAGILRTLDQLGVPTDCVVMIDVETWRGQSYEIRGNHSPEINALATSLRKRQGGDPELVWDYGNQGDLAEVHPNRPDWLGVVVAGYGTKLAQDTVPNMIGQQYTNGQPVNDVAGWPSSTPPFGRCDHNILYRLPGDDMALTAQDVWDCPLTDADKVTRNASEWLKQARNEADAANAKASAAVAKADALAAQNKTMQSQLTALAAQVAKLQTAGVDPATVADQVVSKMGAKLA